MKRIFINLQNEETICYFYISEVYLKLYLNFNLNIIFFLYEKFRFDKINLNVFILPLTVERNTMFTEM